MMTRFRDRTEAGQFLADKLTGYAERDDVVILALPRGGVPVAFEVAQRLRAPLDVLVVRKLGVPGQEELAFGAIASGGAYVLNEQLIEALTMTAAQIERVVAGERRELERREQLYRGGKAPLDVRGKIAIIVDDGLATGSTMRAAIAALKRLQPKKNVVAAPVGARQICEEFKHEAETWCVCAATPEPFYAVGLWYENFEQTTDQEVTDLLLACAEKTVPLGSNAPKKGALFGESF